MSNLNVDSLRLQFVLLHYYFAKHYAPYLLFFLRVPPQQVAFCTHPSKPLFYLAFYNFNEIYNLITTDAAFAMKVLQQTTNLPSLIKPISPVPTAISYTFWMKLEEMSTDGNIIVPVAVNFLPTRRNGCNDITLVKKQTSSYLACFYDTITGGSIRTTSISSVRFVLTLITWREKKSVSMSKIHDSSWLSRRAVFSILAIFYNVMEIKMVA